MVCSFVARIFAHALEDSHSKSGLVHSLSVCISLLDPKRYMATSALFHSFRSQHMYDSSIPVNPETLAAMLPKLGECATLYCCCLPECVANILCFSSSDAYYVACTLVSC